MKTYFYLFLNNTTLGSSDVKKEQTTNISATVHKEIIFLRTFGFSPRGEEPFGPGRFHGTESTTFAK